MTIDKAIEILQHGADVWNESACPGQAAALELGIEALKEVERLRYHKALSVQRLLPEETP